MRIMSRKSSNMVYHRPECKYVRKIRKQNSLQMDWKDAEWKGYRPCRCCDGAVYLYKMEKETIDRYADQFHMDVDLKDSKIYVRTDNGCWKIVYKIKEQRFILLHRNYANGRIRLEDVEKAPFHRQCDVPDAGSIMKYLKYIRQHDEYKKVAPKDYHQMPKYTRRQKSYYHAAKKRAERRDARRVDHLFCIIEGKENVKQGYLW